MILGFLTSRLAGPLATGAAVLLALGLTIQTVRLHDARLDLRKSQVLVSALTADLATCRANTAGLQASLDEQNAAVAALEARTEALDAARRQALAEAETARSAARDRLAAARAVPAGETACETAEMRAAQFLWGLQ